MSILIMQSDGGAWKYNVILWLKGTSNLFGPRLWRHHSLGVSDERIFNWYFFKKVKFYHNNFNRQQADFEAYFTSESDPVFKVTP